MLRMHLQKGVTITQRLYSKHLPQHAGCGEVQQVDSHTTEAGAGVVAVCGTHHLGHQAHDQQVQVLLWAVM